MEKENQTGVNKIAVVLSGGGAGCSFSVGVLSKLIERGIKFDKAFGISGGSLVAAQYSFNGVEQLKKEWLSIKGPDDFATKTYFTRYLWADGYYSTKPLQKRLARVLHKDKTDIHCEAMVGYVDLKSGKMIYVSSKEKRSIFYDACIASASIPIVMESYKDRVDGGVIDVTPLGRAVEDGFKEIYVILANPLVPAPLPWKREWPYPASVAKRALELMSDEIWRNDLKLCMAYNKDPNREQIKLHVYEHNPREIDTFNFTNEDIKKAIAKGEKANCMICGV